MNYARVEVVKSTSDAAKKKAYLSDEKLLTFLSFGESGDGSMIFYCLYFANQIVSSNSTLEKCPQ